LSKHTKLRESFGDQKVHYGNVLKNVASGKNQLRVKPLKEVT